MSFPLLVLIEPETLWHELRGNLDLTEGVRPAIAIIAAEPCPHLQQRSKLIDDTRSPTLPCPHRGRAPHAEALRNRPAKRVIADARNMCRR
jgi:hypothetical protein